MIRGIHGMFYSSDAEASRAFLRDKLKLPFIDAGEGWLIFDFPQGDIGFHPIDGPMGGGGQAAGTPDISFYCDDIHGTVAELRRDGVQFTADVADHGYGWVTHLVIPGGIHVQLFEPKYTKPAAQKNAKAKKPAVKAKKSAAKAEKSAAKAKAKPKAKTKAKKRR